MLILIFDMGLAIQIVYELVPVENRMSLQMEESKQVLGAFVQLQTIKSESLTTLKLIYNACMHFKYQTVQLLFF